MRRELGLAGMTFELWSVVLYSLMLIQWDEQIKLLGIKGN